MEEAKAYVSALRDKHGEEKRWSIFEGKYQSIFDEYDLQFDPLVP